MRLNCPAKIQPHSALHMVRNESETAWRTRHISVKALWLHQMSRTHINVPPKWQLTAQRRDSERVDCHRARKTFVLLMTRMSLLRSMWLHSTSFALSRECQVSNYFNVHMSFCLIEIVYIAFYVHKNSLGAHG